MGHGVVAVVGRGTEDSVGAEGNGGFAPSSWGKPCSTAA